MPDEPEVSGLLALMLLADSRRAARFSAEGDLVLLADQDRSLWDAEQVDAGRRALDRALALRGRGPYVLQAAIAAVHTEQPTDWAQVAALYGELARLTDSPVVALNRAVAVGEAEGLATGLALIDALEGLDGYHYNSRRAGRLPAPPEPAGRGPGGLRAGARGGAIGARAPLPGATSARGRAGGRTRRARPIDLDVRRGRGPPPCSTCTGYGRRTAALGAGTPTAPPASGHIALPCPAAFHDDCSHRWRSS